MGRLAWWQARFRPARTLALIAGVLVAAAAFTVLTAASRTAQLRTSGTVSANFQPAYDILVRPKGARTAQENQTDTVQPGFLSGIYGGITMAQYHQIQQIPGVQVAAPIAMVGYAQLTAETFEPVPAAALGRSGPRLYRISTTWDSDNGASRVTQPPGYLYVTPLRLTAGSGSAPMRSACGPVSTLPPGTNPFGTAAQSYALCWSRVNHNVLPPSPGAVNQTGAGYFVEWTVPVLIAAIDPHAEVELDGLNKAVVSGRYLTEHESGRGPTLPVLASSASGISEYAQTTVQQLPAPSVKPDMNAAWKSAQASAPGRTVATLRTTAQQAYNAVLKGPGTASEGSFTGTPVAGYWSVGPVGYQRTPARALAARQVVNRPSVWDTGSLASVAMDDENSQYRRVTSHVTSGGDVPFALIKVAGVFSPARIRSFSSLSRVPLGAYQPVTAAPVTAASRRALHGGDLLPSQNLGGLVSQPVNLITTLSALPKLENSLVYSGVHAADPISVIRVKVAGVAGPGALSRERINAVAQQIAQRTGLDVDIVAGSSPSPVTIDLPAGTFGPPRADPVRELGEKGRRGGDPQRGGQGERGAVHLDPGGVRAVRRQRRHRRGARAAARARGARCGRLAPVAAVRHRAGRADRHRARRRAAGRSHRGAGLGCPGPERLARTGAGGRARRDRGGRGRPAWHRPGWPPGPTRSARSGRRCARPAARTSPAGSPRWRCST